MIFQYEIIVCTYLISLCVIVFIFAVLLFCQNISLLIYISIGEYDLKISVFVFHKNSYEWLFSASFRIYVVQTSIFRGDRRLVSH